MPSLSDKTIWRWPSDIGPSRTGFETLFTTAAELIEDLSNASKRGHLQESLATYTHAHVRVIDEVRYLTHGPDAANVLFHVVNDGHLRKRPMIFTTNKLLDEWGKVLHDQDMAAAILDRVPERGRFIHLDGSSGSGVKFTLKGGLRFSSPVSTFAFCALLCRRYCPMSPPSTPRFGRCFRNLGSGD